MSFKTNIHIHFLSSLMRTLNLAVGFAALLGLLGFYAAKLGYFVIPSVF